MRIGEFATRSGVPVRALRRLESTGLLHPIGRDVNGFRRYAVDQLPLAQRLHGLLDGGVPAALVRELVAAVEAGAARASTRSRRVGALAAYLRDIDAQPAQPMLDLSVEGD